ncbi:MAG: hypothetical protein A4E20_04000 [Nitrospira sp. SG-bin2]|jgi:hypothetical protein|uniref:hypothetical protein n=1 Tax=Nitrospira cf. moscoviensis SBR1015 TaxID=96242 RepID=UPI000A0A91A6|nr:hypothetical protein [Nitrospira cf. moscoviensis SBR1015]OQW31456.1 MAG: hypothetical protein A4E20_04000 [Nitrospira sp. SG-bin2]
MKSMMVAVMAVIAGLSTGCAQIEYLQNPANYRVNPLNGKRMYCYGDQRDGGTICDGWMSQTQIAQREAQEKIEAERAATAAKETALIYGTTEEREALVRASINRVRVAEGRELIGHAMTDEERELLALAETSNVTIAEIKNTLRVRETKMIAAAKKEAQIAAKAAAFAASPAGKLKAKREAEAQAKRDAEAFNAIFGKKGVFGAAIENYNNMTQAERQRFNERNEERRYQESQQRSRESAARQQAQQDRNVFCHRNFGRSC